MNPPLTPSDLGLTQFQFDNLHKLLAYAKTHPSIPFDIRYYIILPGKLVENFQTKVKPTYPCGTSCCLAGMGVFAGIEPEPVEYWNDYITRVFTVAGGDTFDYLFSNYHANSLPHAIARLEDFLTNGLPQNVELTTHEIL